jgi:hypothetical protein
VDFLVGSWVIGGAQHAAALTPLAGITRAVGWTIGFGAGGLAKTWFSKIKTWFSRIWRARPGKPDPGAEGHQP